MLRSAPFVALAALISILVTEPVLAQRRSSQKPIAVLKQNGYYVTIERGDRVIRGVSLARAKAIAEGQGYLPIAVASCDGSAVPTPSPEFRELQAGQTFSMTFLGAVGEDIALSTSVNLAAGVYKISSKCQDATTNAFSQLTGELVKASNGNIVGIEGSYLYSIFENSLGVHEDVATFPLTTKLTGARVQIKTIGCVNGTAVLERLS